MKLAIFSMMAAMIGDWPLWIALDTRELPGDVKLADPEGVFRAFNRVDATDARRLESWGYRLPSLSVGDLIVLGTDTYRVDPVGFTKISKNAEFAISRAMGLA